MIRAARLPAILLAAFAAAAAAAAPARVATDPAFPDESWVRVGVVAAAASGLEGDRPLRYAYRDGERLRTMLGSVGQIDGANLFFLKAENGAGFKAQLGRIGARIADLKAQGRKVFLQFYYSGHGGARKFHLADGALPFEDVKAALGGDRADARVYVLDVCFGASFFNSKGFRTAPPVQLQMELDPAARGEVLISSSSVDEQAYEVKTLGGSIFTSHWIMALRGAGDRNRDGQVTLFEAYNYAYDRTSGYSAETLDRPQHPSFQMDLTGARDMTLARLLRSSTGILFQNCPAGLYNVVDLQRGIQIGELRIPQGEEFTLALEPGRYRVQYQPGKGASQAADLELTGSSMARLPFAAFSAQVAQAGLPKGSAPEAEIAEPAAFNDPVVEMAPRPRPAGFWARLGFQAYGGRDRFWDPTLEKGMAARGEIDDRFGTGGRFPTPDWKGNGGIEVTTLRNGGWYWGLRTGGSESEYVLRTRGREPLEGLPASEQDRFPVTLEWNYAFSEMRLGGLVGRQFPLTPSQAVGAEAALSMVGRSAEGERTLYRTLYKSAVRHKTSADGAGVRLEAGAAWRYALPARLFAKPIALGARLTPYYTHIRGFKDSDAGLNLAADEMGCALIVTLGLAGRNTPRMPASTAGRNP